MINFGIIGIGRRGEMPLNHYPADRARLSAVAETDPRVVEEFRKEHPDEQRIFAACRHTISKQVQR